MKHRNSDKDVYDIAISIKRNEKLVFEQYREHMLLKTYFIILSI